MPPLRTFTAAPENRRDLLIFCDTAIGLPLAARAHQEMMPVIGFSAIQSAAVFTAAPTFNLRSIIASTRDDRDARKETISRPERIP